MLETTIGTLLVAIVVFSFAVWAAYTSRAPHKTATSGDSRIIAQSSTGAETNTLFPPSQTIFPQDVRNDATNQDERRLGESNTIPVGELRGINPASGTGQSASSLQIPR